MGCGEGISRNVVSTNAFSPVAIQSPNAIPQLRQKDLRLLLQAGFTVIRGSLGLDI